MREVIRSLRVWDAARRLQTTLPAGSILQECTIRRNLCFAVDGAEEPYSMEFRADGRLYRCALSEFQPRTQSVPGVAMEADAGLAAAAY